MKKYITFLPGILFTLILAVPAWYLGILFPIVGGPVFAILIGMLISIFLKDKGTLQAGIGFSSKKILQLAVIFLGFGMNFSVVLATGKQSLPIIISTIATSLIIAFIMFKVLKLEKHIAILIGVGSSICGGSAIAATAPVIEANDDEVAQSISVIFFFNVLAAILFPILGKALGFSTQDGTAFGIFAGTAINDTSSVTAAASTWDTMFNLGTNTLDKAVTVKLTRTLAIIPITLILSFWQNKDSTQANTSFSFKRAFPAFIGWFLIISIITTLAISLGVPSEIFTPFKTLSKFFIVVAMLAIGLNTDIIKLLKTGGRPLILGFFCWFGITSVSLLFQHFLGIW